MGDSDSRSKSKVESTFKHPFRCEVASRLESLSVVGGSETNIVREENRLNDMLVAMDRISS